MKPNRDILPYIRTLDRLVELRDARRSVFCPWSGHWAKPKPAAFMIQLSGEILYRLMKEGMMVYERTANKKET